MIRTFMIAAVSTAAITLSSTAFAQQPSQFGTADQAKAMLVKAVAAVKADKTKALDMFARGDGGFKDRDLYPFCFNLSDGKVLPFANPNGSALFGQDERTLKDAKGFAFGQAFWDAAQKPESQVTEVSYVFPKPGADSTPVQKTAFITKAGDGALVCGAQFSEGHEFDGDSAVRVNTSPGQGKDGGPAQESLTGVSGVALDRPKGKEAAACGAGASCMPAQTAENRLHLVLVASAYAIITMARESRHSRLTIETPSELTCLRLRNFIGSLHQRQRIAAFFLPAVL